MNELLQYPAEFLQETGHVPSACLVLPFEPQLQDKHAILSRLKVLLGKAERRLLQFYSTNKALPVLTRIQELIANINFSNYKKGIALLVSPYSAHLYYLDFAVTELVRTGEDIDIRDVMKAKKKETYYLALVLGEGTATMYLGTGGQLTCTMMNQETGVIKLDKGLDLMLQAYPLPVFILGPQHVLDKFRLYTRHTENILAYVSGDFDVADTTAILKILQPKLDHWNLCQHQFLLQQLDKAQQTGKLFCGIKAVCDTATHHRNQLLVIEEGLPYGTQDIVDDIIENVLKDGGNVEFVPPGTLAAYQQIALVVFHQSQ
ncbi:MAG: hypothetical protein J7621_07785 [Niastella sp.]|nr:hypothetical protein [Niastella sp.]